MGLSGNKHKLPPLGTGTGPKSALPIFDKGTNGVAVIVGVSVAVSEKAKDVQSPIIAKIGIVHEISRLFFTNTSIELV
jgi:hypothetical protein